MSYRFDAIKDLLQRYKEVWRAAWKERHAMAPIQREPDELAFLPAHLELVETPLSPAPHWSARIIVLLFLLALLWAIFGQLDIVAVAPGQTVSQGRTKIIQPLEVAVVQKIFVHEGQLVQKGAPLVTLDSVGVNADAEKAYETLNEARLTELRTTALLDSLAKHAPPVLKKISDLPIDQIKAARNLAASNYRTFESRRQGLQASVREKQAELETVESALPLLKRYASISHDRLAQYEKLIDKGYVSRQDYMLRQQEFIQAQNDFSTQHHRQAELSASLAAAQKKLASAEADMRSQLLNKRRQARQRIKQSRQDVKRTQQRKSLMQLRAPVTGTVQQLSVHTVGGVVTPAEALMAIVPTHAKFEVQANVLDRDIGFVKKGQTVVIKLPSFPYTRYGHLTGTVQSVSHDAIQDEHLGLVFPAIIKLANDSLKIDGTQVRISAGMGVSAEIKTGKRSVIDYLLSPLETHVSEALRER